MDLQVIISSQYFPELLLAAAVGKLAGSADWLLRWDDRSINVDRWAWMIRSFIHHHVSVDSISIHLFDSIVLVVGKGSEKKVGN